MQIQALPPNASVYRYNIGQGKVTATGETCDYGYNDTGIVFYFHDTHQFYMIPWKDILSEVVKVHSTRPAPDKENPPGGGG